MLNSKTKHLSVSERNSIVKLLMSYNDVLTDAPGCAKDFVYSIPVKLDAVPIRSMPYRMLPAQTEKLRVEIYALLKKGFIKRSQSPWSSPCILVPKADNTVRCCIDFKNINKHIKDQSFPIPRIDDLLDKIGGSRFLTNLIQLKGFFQMPLDEKSRSIRSFSSPFGQYQWKRLPFGLKTNPICFSAYMSRVLEGLENICGVYIDDVIIYSQTFEEHIEHVRIVLERLRNAGLTVRELKCDLLVQKLITLVIKLVWVRYLRERLRFVIY